MVVLSDATTPFIETTYAPVSYSGTVYTDYVDNSSLLSLSGSMPDVTFSHNATTVSATANLSKPILAPLLLPSTADNLFMVSLEEINMVKRPLGSYSNTRCFVRIRGNPVLCVIDSGASVTVMDYNCCQSHNLRISPWTGGHIRLAQGTAQAAPKGVCNFDMTIGKKRIRWEAIVLQNLTVPLLLGVDCLVHLRAKINFATSSMTFADDNTEFPLSLRKEQALTRLLEPKTELLRAINNVTIPARHQRIVEVIVMKSSPYFAAPVEGWVSSYEPFAAKYQVWTSNMLGCLSDGRMKVMLSNFSTHLVHISRNQVVALFDIAALLDFGESLNEIESFMLTPASDFELEELGLVAKIVELELSTLTLDRHESSITSNHHTFDSSNANWAWEKLEIPEFVTNEMDIEFVEGWPRGLKYEAIETRLAEDQCQQLKDLLFKYRRAFASNPDKPPMSLGTHQIDVASNRPIKTAPYRVPHDKRQYIKDRVQELLKNNIVQESRSPWSSPVVLVPKKDGTIRFCVDYRKLNAITVKDSYPLPLQQDLLDTIDKEFYSTLDLAAGYWQIPVAKEDVSKTAFVTHDGLYEFIRMPFGLTNAPATFQRFMDTVLSGLKWHNCLVYLDDIVIFSNTFDDHLKDVEKVLNRLVNAGLSLKASKCDFFAAEVEYLGHVVSRHGIKPGPRKIQAVKEFKVPSNQSDTRTFLGLCSYYRRFIPNLAAVAHPLLQLIKKEAKWEWTIKEQKAFELLKDLLTTEPVLAMPKSDREFIVQTDASIQGLGAVLSQLDEEKNERVIAYASRTLSPAERIWDTRELEALAVLWALELWAVYLSGRKVTVQTDHSALAWLLKIHQPNGRLHRWVMRLNEFDFTIVHRPGKHNANADALSRNPIDVTLMDVDTSHPATSARDFEYSENDLRYGTVPSTRYSLDADYYEQAFNAEQVEESLRMDMEQLERVEFNESIALQLLALEMNKDQHAPTKTWSFDADVFRSSVLEVQMADAYLSRLIIYISKQIMPSHSRKPLNDAVVANAKLYRVSGDGLLMKVMRFKREPEKEVGVLVLPTFHDEHPLPLHIEILKQFHDDNTAGHMGRNAMYERLKRRVYFPRMYKAVAQYVQTCEFCQLRKKPFDHRAGRMSSFPFDDQLSRPWIRVAMDLEGPLPKSDRGNTYILVVTCLFSKYPEAVPMPNKHGETVADAIMTVLMRHGIPLIIHSDRGSEFIWGGLELLEKRFGVKHTYSIVRYPQGNPYAERFNRWLIDWLSATSNQKYVSRKERFRKWERLLDPILFAYRTSIHSTTRETPFYLNHGRDAMLPFDVLSQPLTLKSFEDDSIEYKKSQIQYARDVAGKLKEAFDHARMMIREAQTFAKHIYDRDRHDVDFRTDDLVQRWVIASAQKKSTDPRGFRKLIGRWTGPFRILEQVNHVVYNIIPLNADAEVVPIRVHVTQIRPFLLRQKTWDGKSLPEFNDYAINEHGIPVLDMPDLDEDIENQLLEGMHFDGDEGNVENELARQEGTTTKGHNFDFGSKHTRNTNAEVKSGTERSGQSMNSELGSTSSLTDPIETTSNTSKGTSRRRSRQRTRRMVMEEDEKETERQIGASALGAGHTDVTKSTSSAETTTLDPERPLLNIHGNELAPREFYVKTNLPRTRGNKKQNWKFLRDEEIQLKPRQKVTRAAVLEEEEVDLPVFLLDSNVMLKHEVNVDSEILTKRGFRRSLDTLTTQLNIITIDSVTQLSLRMASLNTDEDHMNVDDERQPTEEGEVVNGQLNPSANNNNINSSLDERQIVNRHSATPPVTDRRERRRDDNNRRREDRNETGERRRDDRYDIDRRNDNRNDNNRNDMDRRTRNAPYIEGRNRRFNDDSSRNGGGNSGGNSMVHDYFQINSDRYGGHLGVHHTHIVNPLSDHSLKKEQLCVRPGAIRESGIPIVLLLGPDYCETCALMEHLIGPHGYCVKRPCSDRIPGTIPPSLIHFEPRNRSTWPSYLRLHPTYLSNLPDQSEALGNDTNPPMLLPPAPLNAELVNNTAANQTPLMNSAPPPVMSNVNPSSHPSQMPQQYGYAAPPLTQHVQHNGPYGAPTMQPQQQPYQYPQNTAYYGYPPPPR
ncbi:hypothetical protein SmJEL517_g04106 [Synchytrium microbalum]|uniref:RNA-directed DNA polymerase n=1 Tax=Synchytrium microbalum TaxID=1806994 RepID=A0A507C5M9_9FUNG|nr:uncharacterized protein SmJEL517_g04106 [Synchytrium microbalum]TPX32853.1 hypothetical protein SmJEL517_g04106 [Synchytrium microbalum]